MDLKYIESNIGKKKLKEIKRIDLVYSIIFMLIAVSYIMITFLDNASTIKGLIIYLITILIVNFIKIKYKIKVISETITEEICLDGFMNLNIYNNQQAKKLKLMGKRNYKAYIYSLLNIIDAYIRKGDIEQANNIISFLEQREMHNTGKALLIKHKASIAYNLNNIEEFNRQSEAFEKIFNSLPAQIKNQYSNSLELYKYIIENNVEKVNTICTQLESGKTLLNKIVASYYRGVILEKNNNEEYKKYYKYVVENGNDLNIAKIASEKIGIKTEIKYNRKKHIGFKIVTVLLLVLSVFFAVFTADFYYEMSKTKWETGIVYINDEKVNLPCSISEIEEILDVEIDTTKIGTGGFYKLYLNQDYINVGNITFSSGKYIELYIDDNIVTGITIDISNPWNDELDTELGEMVVFPENITVNSTIEEIHAAYKTGIWNLAMSDWSEEIIDHITNDTIHSGGLKYSGDKYDITIKFKNEKVESVFYYYK